MAITGNILLAAPNLADGPVLAGGAWSANRPRSRLGTDQPSDFARAVGADKRNTWCYVVLPELEDAGVLVAANHNMTTAGKQRWRAFTADPRAAIDLVLTGETDETGLLSTVRAGNATYIGRDRLLHTVGANTLRFAFDLASGAPLGLMYEPAATNLALYSRDLSNAAWVTNNTTATQVGSTGLDGAAGTASRITCNVAGGTVSQAFVLGAAQRVASVHVRAITVTGAVELSADGGATWSAMALGSAYLRFSRTNGAANPTITIRLANAGDIIEVDYAQLEVGSIPTSAILTTGATATRNADAPRVNDAQALGLSFTAGTIVARARLAIVPTGGTGVATLYAGAADRLGIEHDGTRLIFSVVRGSQQVGANGPLLAAGGVSTCAMAWSANDVRYSADGAAAATDSSANMPIGSIFVLYLGSDGGAVTHAGYIERVRVYTTALTNAQLVGLSGPDLEVPADYDSGEVDAWDASWVAAATPRERRRTRGYARHFLPSTLQRLYWRLDLVDEANPNPLQLARIIIGPTTQPAVNMSFGAGLGFEARDLVEEVEGGAEFGARRAPRRYIRFTLGLITEAEAMGLHHGLQAELGALGEVYVQWSGTDTLHLHRRSFVGRIRRLNALEAPQYGLFGTAYEIAERM